MRKYKAFPCIISHRGNLEGSIEKENDPCSIDSAISLGLDVEIDIWKIKSKYYLGHDSPVYSINLDFLIKRSDRLWIHCKNLSALSSLSQNRKLEVFWHQTDNFSLTKNNFIWTYPDHPVTQNSIIVALSTENAIKALKQRPFGICTDYPIAVNDFLKKYRGRNCQQK